MKKSAESYIAIALEWKTMNRNWKFNLEFDILIWNFEIYMFKRIKGDWNDTERLPYEVRNACVVSTEEEIIVSGKSSLKILSLFLLIK